MNGSSLHLAEDRLYPSDNIYDIPCLRIDRQGKALLLPLAPYGAGPTTKTAQTVHFYVEVNVLGIPRTWNAFATRGTHGHIEELMAEVEIARRISGVDIPNLIVYGGGKEIQKYCNENSLLYIHDFMSSKR